MDFESRKGTEGSSVEGIVCTKPQRWQDENGTQETASELHIMDIHLPQDFGILEK